MSCTCVSVCQCVCVYIYAWMCVIILAQSLTGENDMIEYLEEVPIASLHMLKGQSLFCN